MEEKPFLDNFNLKFFLSDHNKDVFQKNTLLLLYFSTSSLLKSKLFDIKNIHDGNGIDKNNFGNLVFDSTLIII